MATYMTLREYVGPYAHNSAGEEYDVKLIELPGEYDTSQQAVSLIWNIVKAFRAGKDASGVHGIISLVHLMKRKTLVMVDETRFGPIFDQLCNGALDAANSPDFRHPNGQLNEDAVLRYRANLYRQAFNDIIEIIGGDGEAQK